jgi:lipopolysaccharide transport system permease protein
MSGTKEEKKPLPKIVYTPGSGLRSPLVMARQMWKDLLDSRDLAWRLTIRDISAQYRQSLLGILWAFFPPIATALIFIVLNNRKIINIGDTIIPYPAFAMFGTVLWQVFVESLNAPLKVVTRSKQMLSKINFHREALILSAFEQTLFSLGIKLLILIVVFILFQIPVTWSTLLCLPAIMVLILLGLTFGLLLTPLGILYTDITQGLTIITGLWFFITPVVYPPPTSFPFSLLTILNPVSPILTGARDIACKGVLNNPVPFFVITFLIFIFLIIALLIYKLTLPVLIERMKA